MCDLMTVAEAAGALGVTVRTAYAYIERGELRAVRPRGRSRGWRVRRDEIERWMLEEWEAVPAKGGPQRQEPARAR